MTDSDLLMSSVDLGGVVICGIAPRTELTTLTDWECHNCGEKQIVRRWSGSGWYDDDGLCVACGESVTGYRPFERAWRKKNIAQAQSWLAVAVPREEYSATTMRLIKAENGWDNPDLHEFRTFDERDLCDMCDHPLADHPMGQLEPFDIGTDADTTINSGKDSNG